MIINYCLYFAVISLLIFFVLFYQLLLAKMGNRIKMKLVLTAEGLVLRVQVAMMEFRTKKKLAWTVEDPVHLVVRNNFIFIKLNITTSLMKT